MKKRYHVINGTLEKRFRPRRFENGVQGVGARPIPPKNDVWADVAEIGVATGTGAAAGAVGGGAGAAIGAGVGFATSLTKVLADNKADQENYDAEFDTWTGQLKDKLQGQVLASNEVVQQQNQVAKKGVYETGTEKIEVEKDELIFTKTPTGKYVLKADYQGGKTHNKGGEDYQAADGDVIFPGKDRKKVMKAYKSQDFPKLESMRMSLPKDTQVAQNGLDNTDPKKQYADIQAQVAAGKLPQSYADNFYNQNAAAIDGRTFDTSQLDFGGRRGFNVDPDTGFQMRQQADGSYARGGTGLSPQQLVEDLEAFRYNREQDFPLVESPDLRPKFGGETVPFQPGPAVTPAVTTPGGGGKGGTAPVDPRGVAFQGPAADAAGIPFSSGATFDLGVTTPTGGTPSAQTQAPVNAGANVQGKNVAGAVGYATQGAAAVANLFPGKAEVQRSAPLELDRLRYKDTSDLLRQQSKINERVQASNARNVAGGNVQNYLANRRQAGISNLQAQQAINVQEYGRAQNIANQNIGIGNQEAVYNNKLLMRDAEVNAANRAARANIIRQGVGQLGELGGTIGRDLVAQGNQDLMIEAIGSGQYGAYGNFKG